MNTSVMAALDERTTSRASLRGVSSLAIEASGSPLSALIDAKLRSDRELQRLNARVRELTAQLAAADERARRSIAGDLHDETGALFTAANLAIGRAEYFLPADAPAACVEALRQARECLVEAADASHRIVEGLHAPAFDSGFAVALADWIDRFGARSALRVDLSCSVEIRVPGDMALALFRVAQEALGNVARHARAEHVTVAVTADAHGVSLAVEDDGVGIAPAARRKTGRFGLAGMRARCEAFGGSLRVAASKTGGTSVRARLPWTAAPRPMLRAVNA